jgi:SAM-dependent methyltransferase
LRPDPYQGLAPFFDHMAGAEPSLGLAHLVSLCAPDVPTLELGCGTGRVLLDLLERGYSADGLDASPAMLDRLLTKAQARGLTPRVTLDDMRAFSLPTRFGAALLTPRAFQHLLTPDDQAACLTCVHRHLLPGGKLILGCTTPRTAWLASLDGTRRLMPSALSDPATGAPLTWWREALYHEASQHITWAEVIERHDPTTGALLQSWRHPLALKVAFPHEVEHLLARCGFGVTACVHNADSAPPTSLATATLTYIAEATHAPPNQRLSP